MVEGIGRRLDPGYVATTALEPYLRQALAQRALPSYWGKRLAWSALRGAQLGLDLPVRFERLLGRIERGDLELGWRPVGVEPVLAALGAMVNRLAMSILAAAFVVGVAVLLLSYPTEGWARRAVQLLLALGLLAVLVLAGMLAASLWRSRRR